MRALRTPPLVSLSLRRVKFLASSSVGQSGGRLDPIVAFGKAQVFRVGKLPGFGTTPGLRMGGSIRSLRDSVSVMMETAAESVANSSQSDTAVYDSPMESSHPAFQSGRIEHRFTSADSVSVSQTLKRVLLGSLPFSAGRCQGRFTAHGSPNARLSPCRVSPDSRGARGRRAGFSWGAA